VIIRSRRSSTALFLSLVLALSTFFSSPSIFADESPADRTGPQNLRITEVTHNTASLEWDFIDNDPNEIDIWNADTDGWVTWGNLTTKTIGGLLPETTYRIYITWNKDRPSKDYRSEVVEFTTTEDGSEYPDPPLTPPSYLRITSVAEDSVSLSWGASPGATGYDIYVNGDWKKGTWSQTATSSTYSAEGGFILGESYSFKVGAQNPPHPVSADSNVVTVIWGELAAPQDLQVVTATRTDAALAWAPVPGATSYSIYKDGAKAGTSDSNRYLAEGLTEGQSYAFKVVAENELWQSPASGEITVVPGSHYNIVTYYTSWSVSPEARNFKPTDIDVSQITHINYAFTDLCWKGFGTGALACQNEDIPLQSDYVFDGEMVLGDHDNDIPNFAQFRAIRDENPHLKLIVSVGGWSWSNNFSNMAKTELTRRAFADSVVAFLREYGLDGIDIDWEYPVEGGEDDNSRGPEDKENFTLLMRVVREALDAAGSEDGKYYLLTIASGQGDNFVVNADLANSSAYLDFINIMTYDYSGSWETLAHHNAPLFYDSRNPFEQAPRNNVTGGALGHLNGGVPNHKLVLGLPYYGKGWIGCPDPGQYATCEGGTPFGTWENGIFDIADVENNYMNKTGYESYYNEVSKVSYLYNAENGVFITYNDETTMMYSASLVKTLDIAGVMSWDISGDRNRTLSGQIAANLPTNGSTNLSLLAAPSGLTLTGKSTDSLTVKWNPSEQASEYEIFVDYVWKGKTSENQFTIGALSSNTSYNVHVLAVERGSDDQITRVSAASNTIGVKTDSPSAGSGGIITPPAPSDVLPAAVSRSGETVTASVSKDAAIEAIKRSSALRFRVIVTEKGDKIEVAVPKEVLAALHEKGDKAELSIFAGGVEYRIPVVSSLLSSSIKITIQKPSQQEIDQLMKAALAQGLKVIGQPLHYKIEAINADGTTTEITNFEHRYLSRIYTLQSSQINRSRTTGAVFTADTGEFHSVPTLISLNTDGTATVELKRSGNSLYSIVESEPEFRDAIADWAREDVLHAAAKLIVTEQSKGLFGGDDRITRAEFISIVTKSLGLLADNANTPFDDISSDTKFGKEIAAALEEGLIRGKSANLFDPKGLITRQDMAVVLANAMRYAGNKSQADSSLINGYADKAKMASYARDAIALMIENEIMLGVSDNTFAPQANASKSQATVAIMRMLRALELSN